MNSEELLRVTRICLRWAVEAEAQRDFEAADAYAMVAANKLARAIHREAKVVQFPTKGERNG